MKIAFLTAGGIAPCLSSAIGGLIKGYAAKYPEVEMVGYLHGYGGLLRGNSITISLLYFRALILQTQDGVRYLPELRVGLLT